VCASKSLIKTSYVRWGNQLIFILVMFLSTYLLYRCQGPWVECQSPSCASPPLSSNPLCTELCRTTNKRRVLRLVISLFLGIVCHGSVWTCTRVGSHSRAEREKKFDIASCFVWLKVDNIYNETSQRANKVWGRLDDQIFVFFSSVFVAKVNLPVLFVWFVFKQMTTVATNNSKKC